MDEIRRLKASDGPELHIWGSSELVQTLIAAQLVDEFRVWIYPVVLGKGKRMSVQPDNPSDAELARRRKLAEEDSVAR